MPGCALGILPASKFPALLGTGWEGTGHSAWKGLCPLLDAFCLRSSPPALCWASASCCWAPTHPAPFPHQKSCCRHWAHPTSWCQAVLPAVVPILAAPSVAPQVHLMQRPTHPVPVSHWSCPTAIPTLPAPGHGASCIWQMCAGKSQSPCGTGSLPRTAPGGCTGHLDTTEPSCGLSKGLTRILAQHSPSLAHSPTRVRCPASWHPVSLASCSCPR